MRLADYSETLQDKAHDAAEYLGDTWETITDRFSSTDDTQFARTLGFASIGIGLLEIAASRQVTELLGIEDNDVTRGTLRVLGVRELCHGASILTESRPTEQLATSLWSRVVGDVLDTALLGLAATKTRKPVSFAITAALVGAIGVADLLCAKRLSQR